LGVEANFRRIGRCHTAMLEDNLLPFSFPAIERKKVTAAFDGGRMTSDGGVMLLAAVEKELGLADRLAPLINDPRNPLLVTHSIADILRARMLAIACGYEDADDLDHLRTDPGFKLACGRLPDSGTDLCSQPTISRWENAPTLREVICMTYALIDTYCTNYKRSPRAVTARRQLQLRRTAARPYRRAIQFHWISMIHSMWCMARPAKVPAARTME
jgi:hypothetical protein